MKQENNEEIYRYESFKKSINIRKQGDIDNSDFEDLYKVIEDLPSELRQVKTKSSCELFLSLVKRYKYNKENISNSFITVIKQLIEIIEVATDKNHNNSEEAFFSFLTRLLRVSSQFRSNNTEEVIQRLLAEYNMFEDIISEVSWLFELLDEEENFVFPISELLVIAIGEFESDSRHLLLLAISLQLFSNMKEMKNHKEREEISNKVLEIADTYHIEILKCLCNGGELIYDISNYVHNNVIAVKNNDNIVIRSTYEDYFTNIEKQDIKKEINKNGSEIAYYITAHIEPNEYYCSFEEFMMVSSSAEKVKLFKMILDDKYYNILQGKSIIMDINTKQFINFSNQFSNSDEHIVFDNTIKDSSYENFFPILADKVKNIRTSVMKISNCDLVTLDFIIQFYLEIVKESDGKYLSCLQDDSSKNDFYQNMIIKNYFEDIIDNKSLQYLDEKLDCYYQFVKQYFCFSDIKPDTKLNNKCKLIFPYSFMIPFGGKEEEFYEYVKAKLFNDDKDKLCLRNLDVTLDLWEYSYKINGNDVSNWTFFELDKQILEEKPTQNIKVLIDEENRRIYSLEQLKRTVAKIKQCGEIKNESVLVYESVKAYNHDKVERICNIINNVGLADCNYNVFGCDMKNNYILRKSIIMYKVLWHFQIMRFSLEKVIKFSELVLDLHYTKSANGEEVLNEFFRSVEEEMKKSGCLVIAKETSSNDGTLYGMFNIVRNIANRSEIMKAFDSNGLRDIKKDEITGKYSIKGKEIKEICILTDLITKGGATKEALNYYLNNSKRDGCLKRFLELNLDGENGIYNIIKANNPKIIVKSIYAYKFGIIAVKECESGRAKIAQTELESAVGKVSVEDHKTRTQERAYGFKQEINIETQVEIPEGKYIINERVCDIVKELYRREENRHGLCCIFRYVNMPSVSVFPKETMKTEYIAGLFNRRGEVR